MYEYNVENCCREIFEKGFSYLPSIKTLIDENTTNYFSEIDTNTIE